MGGNPYCTLPPPPLPCQKKKSMILDDYMYECHSLPALFNIIVAFFIEQDKRKKIKHISNVEFTQICLIAFKEFT